MENKLNEKLFTFERVNNLYTQPMLRIILFNVLMVLLTTWYLWTPQSKQLLLIWLGLRLSVNLFTAIIFNSYKKSTLQRKRHKNWYKFFLLITVVNAFLWGVVAIFPNVFNSVNTVMFIGIMLLGVIAAALPVMSNFFSFFATFALITLLPITVRFFYSEESLYNLFGFMFLIYLGVQLVNSFNLQSVLVNSIRLRFEKIDLIDDLKLKNQQAEEARKEAEIANTAKSKFLAAASHDLRQPLHALGLFVSKLYNKQRYPEIQDDIKNIKKSSDALEGLLNALLDISKLDAGVLKPELTSFNLQAILDKVIVNGESKAIKKGLQLRHRKTNKVVISDMFMLQRILNNLVSNAIRYTATGSIFIGCRQRNNILRIEVRDSGIGITKDELGDIFEEFYQSGNPERDRSKGLGLGLAIVERLCTLLDHKLDVQSAPDIGSIFSVDVPISHETDLQTAKSTSAGSFTSDVAGLNVLVIDDEELIREAMATTLKDWDCTALLADSAESAIEQLQNNKLIPDIIISDYRLRENKTGVEAIQKINQFCKKDIPAIIVTGDTAANRLKEAKDSGYHLLHKPVSPAKLRSVMSYLREQKK